MSIHGIEVMREMERYAPLSFALEKDPVGLQIGNPHTEVKGILVCLDVTEEVVKEAVEMGTNWIIAHHPILFRPLKEVRTDQPSGKLLTQLLHYNMNVYVAHTNLDVAKNGVNDVLASAIGLKDPTVFIPVTEEKIKKLVVFVPKLHHAEVLKAITKAGAGWIGDYSSCSFNMEGMGTFCPEEGTQPFIGEQGMVERVEEIRVETVVTESNQQHVVNEMVKAHPYEEVAYDIYPLDLKGEQFGLGRIGRLEKATTLETFAIKVKEAYQLEGLRIVGDLKRKVENVAILGGSGSKFLMDAKKQNADVYITGDVDYHTAQDAIAHGIALIDPGHHIEHFVVDYVCKTLGEQFKEVPIVSSKVKTNPFRLI